MLPKNKTTTVGEQPKLNSEDKCAYNERASCNYGEFFRRCPYMKYNNSSGLGYWSCKCSLKDKQLNNTVKGEEPLKV